MCLGDMIRGPGHLSIRTGTKVTLNVASLLVSHRLLWVFQELLICWDLRTSAVGTADGKVFC